MDDTRVLRQKTTLWSLRRRVFFFNSRGIPRTFIRRRHSAPSGDEPSSVAMDSEDSSPDVNAPSGNESSSSSSSEDDIGKNRAVKGKANHNKTEVWWDLENVPLPRNYHADRVHEMIVKNLAEKGFTGPVNVTAVVGYEDSYVPRGLLNIQVDVVKKMNRPEGSKNDQTADDGIRARVEQWLENGPQPQNVMLITGDNGFARLVDDVKAAGHTTMVVFLKNVNQPWSSVAISESAEYYWDDWRSFLGRQSKERLAEERKRLAKEKKQRYKIRMREKKKRKKERKRVESAASGSRP